MERHVVPHLTNTDEKHVTCTVCCINVLCMCMGVGGYGCVCVVMGGCVCVGMCVHVWVCVSVSGFRTQVNSSC